MDQLMDWLLKGPPWIQYRARIDLLEEPETHPRVKKARRSMLEHRQVQGLLKELSDWPGHPIGHHRDAGLLLHKLPFLEDIGLRSGDPGIKAIVQQIMASQSTSGLFYIAACSGKGQYLTWMLCDAPLILYALNKFGFGHDSRIQRAMDYLVSLGHDRGWPCAIEKKRGGDPVKNGYPCPYATLVMIKFLLHVKGSHYKRACRNGIETMLNLWQKSRKLHPHEFCMGTDFRKLKAPFVWYDILHVAKVLTQHQWVCQDPRLKEILDIMKNKADDNGKYTPESVYQAWKGWDFGQRKEPSRWLTLLMHRLKNDALIGIPLIKAAGELYHERLDQLKNAVSSSLFFAEDWKASCRYEGIG